MAALEGQAGTLNLSEPCARCGSAIGAAAGASAAPAGGAMPRYYLFPTGNAFHGSCLAAEVIELAGPQQRSHILSLCNRLSQVPSQSTLCKSGRSRSSLFCSAIVLFRTSFHAILVNVSCVAFGACTEYGSVELLRII